MSRPQFVYFIKPRGFDGPIKIGTSYTPEGRLIDLATWSPLPLELVGAVKGDGKDERLLHNHFANLHSHREWFHAEAPLVSMIKQILEAGSIDAVRASLVPVGSIRKRRPAMSADAKLRRSYEKRIGTARGDVKKFVGSAGQWCSPRDVNAIMDRWCRYRLSACPTAEEIERLEEYLANPSSYSVLPSWRTRPPILIPHITENEVSA